MRKRLLYFALLSLLFISCAVRSSAEELPFKFDKNTVFIGDSTTNSFRRFGLLSGGNDTLSVWTGAGNTLSMWDVAHKTIKLSPAMIGYLRSLPDYPRYASSIAIRQNDPFTAYIPLRCLAALTQPETIVITLGINGCSMMSDADFSSEYRYLVETLSECSPNSRIVLNSIFPVTAEAKVSNADIDRKNRLIRLIAADYGLLYIDTNTPMKNQNGVADKTKMDSPDGIHWNYDGCKEILGYIYDALISRWSFAPLSCFLILILWKNGAR